MIPACSSVCKLRCAASLLMIIIGLTMLVHDVRAESAEVATQTTAVAPATTQTTNATTKPGFSEQGSGYLLQLLSGMAIVVLCIIVLAWFARKMNRFQTSTDGSLHILGGISMGARERLVLVQVGEQQLLLGVAPGRINTLHVLQQAVDTSNKNTTAQASFGQQLVNRMQAAVKHGDDRSQQA